MYSIPRQKYLYVKAKEKNTVKLNKRERLKLK